MVVPTRGRRRASGHPRPEVGEGRRRSVARRLAPLHVRDPRSLHALGLRTIVSDYLGGRPVLSANKCTLRRVSVKTNGDWHQDGAFLGRGIRAINMWLTLTPCGVDAPGLDLVPRRFDAIVETGTGGAYFDWAVGPEVVERGLGRRRDRAAALRRRRPADLRRPLPPPHRDRTRDDASATRSRCGASPPTPTRPARSPSYGEASAQIGALVVFGVRFKSSELFIRCQSREAANGD